ncbi:pentapeptide repeat-containing protein [Rhodococcus sp. 2H158]
MNLLDQTDRPQRTWIAPRPTSPWFLAWLAGITLAIAVAIVWIGAERATSPGVSVFEADLAGLGRAVGLIGAVSIAVPGAVLAYRRQRSLDESNQIKAEADYLSARANFHSRRDGIEQDRRTRFVSIAEQLADPAPIVRMAAISAMEALADEWLGDMYVAEPQRRREAQACVNVLCSYLRSPYLHSVDSDRPASLTKKVTKTAQTVEHATIEEHHEYRPNDLEVRLTIVRVIAAHLQPVTPLLNRSYDDGRRYGGLWSHMDLDLTGAYLYNPNFSWCLFDGKLTLDSARLTGDRVSFEGAHFTGEQASFEGAHFAADWVLFGGAHFTGDAEFSETQFIGKQVRFHKAHFTGKQVRFHKAQFTSAHVWFHEVHFGIFQGD